jgi:hypothetical protein
MWQGFDPLPILRHDDDEEEGDSTSDDPEGTPVRPDSDLLGERFDR